MDEEDVQGKLSRSGSPQTVDWLSASASFCDVSHVLVMEETIRCDKDLLATPSAGQALYQAPLNQRKRGEARPLLPNFT